MKEEEVQKQQQFLQNEPQSFEEISLSKDMICREVVTQIPEIKLLGLTLLEKAIAKLFSNSMLLSKIEDVMITIKVFIFHS